MENKELSLLLDKIEKNNITLNLKDKEDLAIRIDRDVPLNQEVIEEIKLHKFDLIAYLEKLQEYHVDSDNEIQQIIANTDDTIDIPLSYAQERLYFIDKYSGTSNYHIPIVLRIEGGFDIPVLLDAVRQILKRHQSLRTVFIDAQDEPYQKVLSVDQFSITQQGIKKEDVNRAIEATIKEPFDLSKDYMLRVNVLSTSLEDQTLVMVMHHIASDGWSVPILLHEIEKIYNAGLNGEKVAQPPLEIQYSDYSLWQRKHVSEAVLNKKLTYWKNQLSTAEPLELPLDYQRPSIQKTEGASYEFEIPQSTIQGLKKVSQTEGATLFMILLGVCKTLLYRYSGQNNICVGTPIANRGQEEISGLIGYFVNTLPLHTVINGQQSFREFLSDIRQTTLTAYDYQDVPFEKIVEAVITDRDQSRTPLFQVLFSLQNNEQVHSLTLGDTKVSSVDSIHASSKFDLSFDITEFEDRLLIGIEYCTALFKESTIARMASHFKALVASVLSDIDTPISKLSMLSETESHQLLEVFNDTNLPYDKQSTIVSMFRRQSTFSPDTIAISCGDVSMTYEELEHRSTQLSHYLHKEGVRPGMKIPICMDRSIDMIIGVLGILKTGSCYVPIDPDYPSDRISFMLSDTDAGYILTDSSLFSLFRAYEGIIVYDLNSLIGQLADVDFSEAPPLEPVTADTAAYIIYTSGSTGVPKGVVVAHRSIVRLSYMDHLPIDSDTRTLQVSSISFDAATFELWSPLLHGGSVVLYPERHLDLQKVNSIISTHNVNTVWFTSALFDQWVDSDGVEELPLRYVLSGGDVLKPSSVSKLYSRSASVTILNGYGPTENTTFTCCYRIPRDFSNRVSIPIGSPIIGTQVYVLDREMQLCPVGVPGELYTSGEGIALGYLNRPDFTKERFVSNPYGSVDSKLYKTGDVVRWLSTGDLEFIGRNDNQVKIRGFRIELEEIEQQLDQLPQINKSTVIVKETPQKDKFLVAYVIPNDDYEESVVKHQLKTSLPGYMLPQFIEPVAEFPITTNGKIDKDKLSRLSNFELKSTVFVPATSQTEKELVTLWKDLLGKEKISTTHSFFELGGHSLLVMRLTTKIRSQMNIDIDISTVFENPTIKELAAIIDQKESTELIPILQHEYVEDIPLSFSQERLWFLDTLSGTSNYHIPIALKIKGNIDTSLLKKTLKTIIQRHESLRTVFYQKDGKGYQKVLPVEGFTIQEEKLQREIQPKELLSIIDKSVKKPFDLSKDYMVRANLFFISEEETILVITMHHIASDGWSIPIFISEIETIYTSYVENTKNLLEPISVQYSDYSIWQRTQLSEELLNKKLDFWKKNLDNITPLVLPTDYARPSVQSTKGAVLEFEIDQEDTKKIHELSLKQHTTVFMTLLSVFKVVLYRYTGQNDICIGTPVANRGQQEITNLIGFFVNTLAIRTLVEEDSSFTTLLQQIKENTLQAYDHQEVPFESVVDAVTNQRDQSRSPIFQVLFSIQNNEQVTDITLGDTSIESITLPHDTATFDLSCNITERDHKLYVEFEYCTALFKKSTIERLEQHFKNAISCLTLNPETRIQEVALLGIQERQRLLIDFNDNHIQYAQEETILDMFTQQLIANPDHIALKLGDVVYSYDSLDKKSNQLAHYLQASGVEREEYIPICLERSIDMVIGVLGILKAGAVFIPIDPSYPKKRIEFILKDTNARKIISRSAYRDRFSSISTITPIFQEEIQNELQVQRTDTPQIPISPEQRAYVIYTSGTTGKAKGVVCNHKGLYSSMRARNDYYKGYQKALLTLSFSFDASYAVVFGTLLSGGTLVLVKEEEIYDISRIANIFNDNEIDTVICGSQYYNLILSVDTINLDTLKTVILGGDHLPQKSIQKHFEKTRASLYNEYGPTEATIWASVSKISADSKVTIGKPIANTHIHILDDQLELVPIGVVGELCIAGRQLAVGYLNREELTKEKFVNNPFTHHNERLYKTGDLARWLPDGTIEFIGRKDDQVKIRGYRIELAEITYQLDELTSIHQSIVIAKTDKQGTKHIVAYIVTDNTLDTSWIQDQLKDKLPDYMIPKIYVFIDAIPLTYNGKVDKKKLPEPDFSLENTYRAPTTITEQQLVAIWKELLEKEKIGVLDNFFELGGDSIKAIQLVSKAKERNIFFKVKDVFTYQNISAIASNLVKAQDILTEQGKLIGESGLLPVQKMFFETRYTYYNHYNQSMLLSLDKAITYDKLKKVITILIDKHDALRFQYQDIHTANPIQRYITKATSLKRELVANETEITKICESYQQSLSVTEGQIASFVLLETPSDFKKNRLFMAVHHLAIDGVSWRIIFEDLHKLLVKDTVLFIDTKTTSYRQWHKKLTMLAQSVYIHSQRFYWQDILQNYTPLLPENKSEEITTYGNTYHHSNSLSVEATESILSKIHHIYATEINDVLLSALAIVVSNWTNKEKNVIGLEGHGREEIFKNVDVSQTVGWFTSFYPVCLSKQNTIAETIIHTKDFLRSIPDKGIGFGVLKYLSDNEDIQKSLATNFDDITFNYLGTFDNSMSDDMYFDFAKESKGNDINPANHNPHQLAINCVVVDKQLVVNWSYDSLRYTKETISKLATSYQLELENVIKHCLEQTEKVKTSSDYGLSNFVSAHELSSFIKNDNHPSVIEDIYTLSPLQEGMLFHNLLGDNTEAYVIQFSFDFVKGFDKELFIKSWETLSKTHNILRTAFFVNQFEQPVQVVYKNLALSVTEINYSQLTEEEVTIAVDTFLTEDRKKGFDIEKPPLVRFTLIKLPDNSTKCVITNHHLLWDGWSFSLLMNRFIQIYQTIQEGNLLPVLEKDNYGDLIKDIKNKNQLGLAEFWTVYLQSIEKPAYLPFINTPSDRNKVFANTTDEVLFTKDQTRKIIDFVQKHHITTNTLLQGAWAYLLSQYTSTDSVVFGTTISGRDAQIKNIENKVGLYINTIPVCTTVNKNLLVIDWLKEIQSQHTNAREEYGYVPLSQIESYSDVKEALFDSLLVFENYPVGTSDTADKTNIEINNVVAEEYGNYVVSLSISLQSDHLSIKFTYNNKQLDAYFVELIKGHLQTVLFKMLSDITLKEISYRTATEDNNVLQFNTTKCQYPKDKSIITLFDEWVAKQPNAVAVTHHDQEVNYKELYDKSVQIAQYLINKGVSRQENIAVLMDRGLDMISSILGILRAGAVYVPIHKEYPVERLHYILEDARVNYIVCSDISDVETKVTSTTGLLNVSEAYDIEFDTTITDKATIEDTMYIMYTSGTTGEPKGVAVSHKNVIKLVNEKGSIAIRDNDNVLQWSNFAFDGSIYEIFGTLLNGAHLHLINEEHAADAFALTEIIEQKEISVSFMTTTLFNAVVDTNVYALKNIRKLLFGGEKASTYHVKKAFEALGKGKLINVYGPTETVVFATTYDVNTVPENTTPIGKPLNNTILYVLNKDKEICSIGVPGELYIGGDNVSKGYWKKPSLTEQCFIDNPFNKGETLYKTGDLVKWLPDGSIDFVDRIGGQVKIRGYRIELGEIETVLESLESINKAIAHVVSYDTDKQLVAYIQSDTDIDTSEIISCLKKTLPEYMVPIAFVPVANFPRNINGKIDKKSLPDPRDWMSESKEYVGPETTNQQKMITIWERILHNPKIGIYDDFFEKGGHSLSAIRLVSAVRAAYNVDVGIQTIFEHPKLVDLVAFVQEQEISKVPQIEVCKDKKNIPLSFTQERLWFIDKLSGTVNYHIPIILRVSGAFDQKVFLESTTQILTRHESLRTVFKESEGVAYQEVISADTFTLDKSKVEAQEILETVEQIINQPFDLSRDYMLRVALLQISEKEHVIAIVTHHIASDGWSIPIFIQELEQLYNAGLAREQITLPVLPVQYSDYSIWQHSYLSGGILDTKLSYWKKQLSGVSTLALPLDYPRPQIQQTKGAVYEFEIPTSLTKALHVLTQSEGGTLFMTLLGVYKVLLHKYSGQNDICVGTPVANRGQYEISGLIGYFVNTIALRSFVDQNQVFKSLLSNIRETTLSAFDHQEVSFEKIVDTIVSDRDQSSTPLFQVMFSLQNNDQVTDITLGEAVISSLEIPHSSSKFDITFDVTEVADRLLVTVEYCTALFKEATIARMSNHFMTLAESVTISPELPISQLPMLTSTEKEELICTFNKTESITQYSGTVLDMFAHQVNITPEAIAISHGDKKISYEELDKRSNYLAYHLQNKGVTPETLVPICIPRSIEMIVAILGVLKSGGAYVPIDPTYPKDRITFIINDTEATIVLTTQKHKAQIDIDKTIDVLCIETLKQEYSKKYTPVPVSQKQLAYVIYTSGTTGTPKGVMIEHASLVNLCKWHQEYYAVDHTSKVLMISGEGFDASVWEIFPYITSGAELFPIDDSIRLHSENLYHFTVSNTISHAYLPVVLYHELMNHESVNYNVKYLVGGESLTLQNTIDDRLQVYNNYGPTENTVVATCHTITNQDKGKITIGEPIDNVQVYVLDDQLAIVPIGVVGELYIGGAQVARGYLNKPELTKEKFINNPFSTTQQQERLYKTGDLVRWLPSGKLEFVGRNDNQIKIRGYRVELEEIRYQLLQLEEIKEAIVIANSSISKDTLLVAYLVSHESFDTKEIHEKLKGTLPSYMIPGAYVNLDKIPLTPNGKIDITALPYPEISALQSVDYKAAETTSEKRLVQIYQELLGVEKVGVYDDFFRLGGNSLLVIRLIAQIRTAFKIEVTVQDIFTDATIYHIAKKIENSTATNTLPPLEKSKNKESVPLSFSQERLWFLHKLSGSQNYHIPMVFRVRQELHKEALAIALKKIIERHESLRTVFAEQNGEAMQAIIPSEDFELHDIAQTPINEQRIEEYLNPFITQPFDISQEYSLRAGILPIEDDSTILVLVMHHIASDGWSVPIFANELTVLYKAAIDNAAVSLPTLPVQYSDYSIWQRSYLSGEVLEKKLLYWKKHLEGVSPLELPTDFIRPPVQQLEGKMYEFSLENSVTNTLKDIATSQESTLFMVLLSLYKIVLFKYSGQEDICIGTPVANRGQEEVSGLIGYFVNTLALRTQVKNKETFVELLKKVKNHLLEAYEHQDVPFEKVVDTVVKERDQSRTPLFQVLLSLENTTKGSYQNESSFIEPVSFPHTTSKFDISMNISESEDGLSIGIEYCTALFKESTIARMASHFKALVASVLSDIDMPISKLSMLSDAESHQLLDVFNDTNLPYDKQSTIVSMFRRQSTFSPDTIAISCGDVSMTYEELEHRSTQISHYLHKEGVRPGMKIPICMDRSIDMIIGVLGILKTGSCYVPIDPDYPSDRISFMLSDTDAGYILTDSSLFSLFRAYEGIIVYDLNSLIGQLADVDFSEAPPLEPVTADTAAYIIYTSGSTGVPKGVVVAHRSIVRLSYMDHLPIDSDTRTLQVSSISFDAATFELWSPLLHGGSVVLYPERHLDLQKVNSIISTHNVNTVWFTSALFDQWVDSDGVEELPLRYVLSGGDVLKPSSVSKLYSRSASVTILNGYGPTENTTFTCCYRIPRDFSNRVSIPIGSPIIGTQVYVLDREMQLCPVGVPGELYTSGEGIALGYLNRPDFTKERFVSNPYGSADSKLYKTGDVVRWLSTGDLEFIGRNDNQVKIRGFRIELEEISYQLNRIKEIKQSFVTVDTCEQTKDVSIVAYIVSETNISKDTIITTLRSCLPSYMIPQHYISIEALPITANGKIDTASLPRVDKNVSKDTYVAPRNELEEKIAAIWKEVLSVDQVGVYDNFFSIGGNSILAIKLVAMLQQYFQMEINDIFEYPTIDELIKNISYEKNYLKHKLESYISKLKAMEFVEQFATKEIKKENKKATERLKQQKKDYIKDIKKLRKLNYKKKISYDHIFLLGGTGYLGVHLLFEILEKLQSKVTLLIRGEDQQDAENRIRDKYTYYFGKNVFDYNDRVQVINGDITEPFFAIEQSKYEALAEQVDCILNTAANVKHYGKQEDFEKVNTLPIHELVSFSLIGTPTPIHHISTLSIGGFLSEEVVAQEEEEENLKVIFTEQETNKKQQHFNHYAKSKFDADTLLDTARAKGAIVNIYRVGNLSYHSKTGHFQENIENNAFYNQIRANLFLGGVIHSEIGTEISCIDRVAQAITKIFDKEQLLNRNYHLKNDNLLDNKTFIKAANKNGFDVQSMESREFLENMLGMYDAHTALINRFMLHLNIFDGEASKRVPYMLCNEETEYILKKLGFAWNPNKEREVKLMLNYGRKINYWIK